MKNTKLFSFFVKESENEIKLFFHFRFHFQSPTNIVKNTHNMILLKPIFLKIQSNTISKSISKSFAKHFISISYLKQNHSQNVPKRAALPHKWKLSYQIEREPTAIIGSSRCPVRTIIVIKYQISRQSMTAEATDSFTKAHKSLNASHVKPFQPSLHQPTM